MIPAIFGLSGPTLTRDEQAFFADADPAGFILFRRNCETPDQLRALTAALRATLGRDLPILIDQEGGRVARLQPPHWPAFPAAARLGELYEIAPLSAIEAARLNGVALAAVLQAVGVNVDCVPLLDLPSPEGDAIIGDRAFGDEPMRVAALGRAMLEGLAEGGVVGVVKHLPGHGRAPADSHLELPVVGATRAELERDFEPFARLAPIAHMGMTAHVVFTALDPDRCASVSPTVIADIIRGRIGFNGWLMSDDLDMAALDGTPGARAGAVIAAGCDVALQCSGNLASMIAVASVLGSIGEASAARLARACAGFGVEPRITHAEAAAGRDRLLALA